MTSKVQKNWVNGTQRHANYAHVDTVDHDLLEACFKMAQKYRGKKDTVQPLQLPKPLDQLGDEAYFWIQTVGFVPYKIFGDAESGLSIPYIPDPQDYEVRIIEHAVTRARHHVLYFPASDDPKIGDGGYDPNANVFVPMLGASLRYPIASRLKMWKIMRETLTLINEHS